jgi:hypothetical protein
MQSLPKITFNQVLKSPPTYMLMVAVSLLWFFVYKFSDSSTETITNLKEDLIHQREENKALKRDLKMKDQKLDSMGALMLLRTDRQLDQIRKWISIDTTKKSTVIIKKAKK